ncbi:unnamed protein product [Adineta ricciae]|uniref:Uncharacterized protein n=1 Tax=Adineta ricciae TaxID=249248 RepID=A0A815UNK4_ADIRI|nr:unnamed protein product [Adineta ricciae]
MQAEYSKNTRRFFKKLVSDMDVIPAIEQLIADHVLANRELLEEIFNAVSEVTTEENRTRLAKIVANICIDDKSVRIIEEQLKANADELDTKKIFVKEILMEITERLCRQFKQACGDDRKRGNIAFCLSKLNIKTLASYRILKENFPNVTETNGQTEDDYDEEEHLAWKKYLMPVLTDIERRLKPMEINSSRRVSTPTTPKRKLDRLS